MAQYPGLTLTNAGLSMIAESQASSTALIFTNLKIGDGSLAIGEDIKVLTAVKNPLLTAPIQSYTNQGDGQVKLRFTISNGSVTTGFFAREIGIYAKLGESGVEQLYAYSNAGNLTDFIPDKNTPIDEQIIDIYLIVGNASSVSIVTDGSIMYVTKDDMDEHKSDKTAHSAAFTEHNKLKSSATTYGHSMASSATPLIAGTAAVGTDNGKFAREGHVHPAQVNITGNADTVDNKHASDFEAVHPQGSFFIEGNANTFYPVIFVGRGSYDGYANRLIIKRHVHQDMSGTGSTWLEAEWSAGEWGGNGHYHLVKNYHVVNWHVADFDYVANNTAFVVWLRGQRTYYWGGSLGVVLLDYNAVDSKTLSSQTFNSKTTVDKTDGYFYNGELLATVKSNVASASKVLDATVSGQAFTLNWQGKSGQPTWLLGGTDRNLYVYDPANFDVAKVGGYTVEQLLARAGGIVAQSLGVNGYVKFTNGLIVQWGRLVLGTNAFGTKVITPSINRNLKN